MRILILGINYFPERTSVSPFTTGLSEHLAASGHEVRVVTAFPYYPEWRTWKEYRGRLTQLEMRNGVEIRRVLPLHSMARQFAGSSGCCTISPLPSRR